MSERVALLNTAYFPPVEYFSIIRSADRILIEREENYTKQSYRNRCVIYSANGPMALTVPVLMGSFHKTPLKDIKIDYSKRWQQIHIGAFISSYKSSPFFDYYFNIVEKTITRGHTFLVDLNLESIELSMDAVRLKKPLSYTGSFRPLACEEFDYRDKINPKKKNEAILSDQKKYNQVFGDRYGFIPGLSILDLIFNTGPDATDYLKPDTQCC